MISASVIPSIALVILYILQLKKGKLEHFYKKYFFIPFYFSVIGFAFMHSFNFDFYGYPLLVIPFIFPMIISGVVLGFARMKFGMWANFLIHIGFNLTTFILDKGMGI